MEDKCECGSCECGDHQDKSSNMKASMKIETGDDMCDTMVEMANKAWMKLMVDKMKNHWEKTMGKQMDSIAEASVKTSMAYHMNMMKGKSEVQEAAKKIREAMSSP